MACPASGSMAQVASPGRGDVGAAWHRVQSLGKCRRMSSEAVAGAVGQRGASEPEVACLASGSM